MKRSTGNAVLLALATAWALVATPLLAAGISKANYAPPGNIAPVSDRLIVKFKPNSLPKGLNVAQISAELSRPFTAQTVSQMQAAAEVGVTELHALSNGAHVLSIPGSPNRKAVDQAIAGIAGLADVEYVEEDRILTTQAAPNDSYYTTGLIVPPNLVASPGLWGMWPASVVASPAPGETGSYGADFETAWATSSGTGVVVAVVDTGITPHVDIVGDGGTVSPATGNLVSPGYTFISDCRIRGTCAAITPTASAFVAPSLGAIDLGSFISAQDIIDNPTLFPGPLPSNSSWHGTHVAGTIAAIGNNAAGVIGGAYNAKILPVRTLGKGGGHTSDIAEGIKWAVGMHPTIANPNSARVINLSMGGTGPCSITLQTAIDAAVATGAVVVVAAGNANTDVANFSPANCNNVISVAAIARDGSRASYSNFSSPTTNITNPVNATLAAPGGEVFYPPTYDPGILSTVNTSPTTPDITPAGFGYGYKQGTSMATPHVAAAVALMMARNPALTPAQIKTILSAPASLTAFPSFSTPGFDTWDCATNNNCGAGILNAYLAVQNSLPSLTALLAPVDFGSLPTNATTSKNVIFTNSSANSLTADAATISGANAAFFAVVTDTCNAATIAPSGTCQIIMNYTPTAAGNHSATLSVPTSAIGVTAISASAIGLTGIAGYPLIVATPIVTAATVYVGQSTTVDLVFSNPNATAEMLGVVTLSQPAIMAVSMDTCSNNTLAAAATCGVTVTVTPAAAGAYSGAVTVGLSKGRLSPTQVTISGTANAAPATGGGGGGCSIMPAAAYPDSSLPLAMFIMLAYWLRQRVRTRGEA